MKTHAPHIAALVPSSPAWDVFFTVLWLVPLAVMLVLFVRHRRRMARRQRASRFDAALAARHEAMNTARGLYTRCGSCELEMLAALALCLVWYALLVALFACANGADLAVLVTP